MGFYFRRSASFGPFRVNLSKSGVGYSIGGRGFRTGVSGSGRRYTSCGIPGTGFGYRQYAGRGGGAGGCLVFLVAGLSSALAASVTVWRTLH